MVLGHGQELGECGAKRSHLLTFMTKDRFSAKQSDTTHLNQGEIEMGDKGKKVKGKKEHQKKAQLNLKEKRKVKKEKKSK